MDNDIPQVYKEHLFTDDIELQRVVPSLLIRQRIKRIQSVYTLAQSFPWKKSIDLVNEDRKMYKISRTQAFEDVRIAQALLGSVNAASKDYIRWVFNEEIMSTYRAACKAGDNLSRVKALDAYAKYNKLGVEDQVIFDVSILATQPFTMTDDPAEIGLRIIPNIRKVIADTIAEFSKNDIIDVEYEEVDMEFDPFARSNEDGGAAIEEEP